MDMQNVSNLQIPEGMVKTIHDEDNRLLWGAVGYDTKYAGDTFQQTYSGKNIFDQSWFDTYVDRTMTYKTFDIPNGTYTMSTNMPFFGTSTCNVFIGAGTTLTPNSANNGVSVETPRTITVTNGNYTVAYRSRAGTSDTGHDPKDFNWQLEQGSTATSYEPYTGGIPAPNPDYPQDIQVVTGEQTVEVTGKNLIYTNPRTNGGVTFSYNPTNGATTISGTPTRTYAISATNSISIPAGVYTISLDSPKPFNVGIGTRNASNVRTATYIPAGSTSVTITRTEPVVGYDIYVSDLTSDTYISDEFKVMLEQGSTATAYELYQSHSYTINLGSIELCKIGDYQDYIYKSGDDWYLHKAINKVVLNGSEAWAMYSGRDGTFYITKSDIMLAPSISATPDVISDYYEPKPFISLYNMIVDYGVANHNAQRWIAIRNKDYSDVSSFKTWLASNNTTVYYVLATPTDTKITDATLVGQLNDVHGWLTRYGYNATVSGDLPIVLRRDSLQ